MSNPPAGRSYRARRGPDDSRAYPAGGCSPCAARCRTSSPSVISGGAPASTAPGRPAWPGCSEAAGCEWPGEKTAPSCVVVSRTTAGEFKRFQRVRERQPPLLQPSQQGEGERGERIREHRPGFGPRMMSESDASATPLVVCIPLGTGVGPGRKIGANRTPPLRNTRHNERAWTTRSHHREMRGRIRRMQQVPLADRRAMAREVSPSDPLRLAQPPSSRGLRDLRWRVGERAPRPACCELVRHTLVDERAMSSPRSQNRPQI